MTTPVDWHELLEHLSYPFPEEAISWRAGATTGDKKRAQALPYADPRAYEDRLNEVCPGDWSVAFRPWGESRIICDLTIHGVSRSSTGEFEEDKRAFAQGTVAEAQAFKRACSKFGLGRYLYDIPTAWVEYDAQKSRLVETPKLPSRFLPSSKPSKAAVARATTSATTPTSRAEVVKDRPDVAVPPTSSPVQADPPRLSEERAEAMATELQKLGFARREQLKLATSVLGEPVRAFTQLSEADALEVWASAKRLSKRIA